LNYLFACASDLHYFWVEHWEHIMWFIIYDYRVCVASSADVAVVIIALSLFASIEHYWSIGHLTVARSKPASVL